MAQNWGKDLSLPERFHAALSDFDRYVASLPDPDARRDPRAARYHRQARSENTRRMYKIFIWYYLEFTDADDRRIMPANAASMEAFAIWLINRRIGRGKNKGRVGMAPNSLRLAMSAVRTFHRVQAENPPDLALANGVIDGYERERADDPTCLDGKGAPALRLPSLAQIFAVCDPDTLAGARDRALLSLGWTIMARRSELSGIDLPHLRLVPNGLEVLIRKSKTDQLARGRTVGIPHLPSLGDLNPVPNVLRWRDLLAERDITEGPYLRAVDRHGRINGTDQWAGHGGVRLYPQTVEEVVRKRAIETGVADAERMSGHSLRRGGAQIAYANGADVRSVAKQGGWGERSPVVFRYLDDIDHWTRNALEHVTFKQEEPR